MPATIQTIVDRLRNSNIPREELIEYFRHDAALVRVNAFEAATKVADGDPRVVEAIAREAMHEKNEVRLMGTVTVGHVAVGCLIRIGTPGAISAARELVARWPQEDRKDLLNYLQDEGLL